MHYKDCRLNELYHNGSHAAWCVSTEAVLGGLRSSPHRASRAVLQAHRNSVARDALAAEFGLLSSSDVAELSGSAARNAGATAARWRAAGRIFAVTSGGKAALFPGFQFDAGGQPVPVIADILAALADRLDPWSLALWFTGDNPRLGGLRPVDALSGDPDAVLAAARALADDLT